MEKNNHICPKSNGSDKLSIFNLLVKIQITFPIISATLLVFNVKPIRDSKAASSKAGAYQLLSKGPHGLSKC